MCADKKILDNTWWPRCKGRHRRGGTNINQSPARHSQPIEQRFLAHFSKCFQVIRSSHHHHIIIIHGYSLLRLSNKASLFKYCVTGKWFDQIFRLFWFWVFQNDYASNINLDMKGKWHDRCEGNIRINAQCTWNMLMKILTTQYKIEISETVYYEKLTKNLYSVKSHFYSLTKCKDFTPFLLKNKTKCLEH